MKTQGEDKMSDEQQNFEQQNFENDNANQTSNDYQQPYQNSSMYNQQTGGYQQNGYQQNGYQQNGYQYQQPYYGQAQQQDLSTGFGVAAMVLGIVSIVLFFSGINIVCSILAIVFGAIQLGKPKGHKSAIAGIICGGVGIVLSVLLWMAVVIGTLGLAVYQYGDDSNHHFKIQFDGHTYEWDGGLKEIFGDDDTETEFFDDDIF